MKSDPFRRQPAIRTIAMPADTNSAGDIFGAFLAPVSVSVGDEVSMFAEIVSSESAARASRSRSRRGAERAAATKSFT
jgi:hypothetical protein